MANATAKSRSKKSTRSSISLHLDAKSGGGGGDVCRRIFGGDMSWRRRSAQGLADVHAEEPVQTFRFYIATKNTASRAQHSMQVVIYSTLLAKVHFILNMKKLLSWVIWEIFDVNHFYIDMKNERHVTPIPVQGVSASYVSCQRMPLIGLDIIKISFCRLCGRSLIFTIFILTRKKCRHVNLLKCGRDSSSHSQKCIFSRPYKTVIFVCHVGDFALAAFRCVLHRCQNQYVLVLKVFIYFVAFWVSHARFLY